MVKNLLAGLELLGIVLVVVCLWHYLGVWPLIGVTGAALVVVAFALDRSVSAPAEDSSR